MTEQEFLARWNSERDMYEAWGHHVVSKIIEGVSARISPVACDLFMRIPPKPRVKGEASILEKAFRRKSYKDPYNDITDKVGVRFVVLLGRDIVLVSNVIERCTDWSFSKDRDYEKEIAERPIQFEYAAVHYVVRAKSEISIGSVTVPAGTPCEVQVKTLLQHAYSELTHDTIYKPTVVASPDMKRTAAKSMALLEATGDYFEKVFNQVEAATAPAKGLSIELSQLYAKAVGKRPEVTRAEGVLLEAYEEALGTDVIARVDELLKEKSFIGSKIQGRIPDGLLFRQPSILLAYLMAAEQPTKAKCLWPFTPEELRPIYTDLGKSFDSY